LGRKDRDVAFDGYHMPSILSEPGPPPRHCRMATRRYGDPYVDPEDAPGRYVFIKSR